MDELDRYPEDFELGINHLGEDEIEELYERDPFICTVIEAYAHVNDVPIEDVIYGPTEHDRIDVGAPHVGLTTVREAIEIQQKLDESMCQMMDNGR